MTYADKVYAVVLNYNSSNDTKKCIGYLKQQDYPEFHIVVVDNKSTDENEIKALEEICRDCNVHLIKNKINSGYSAGNNVGLRYAVENGAAWCMITNPDVELRDPHYISYVMKKKSEFKNVGIIGTNILNPDGSRQNPSRNLTPWEEILFPLETIKQKLGIWDGYLTKDETGYCEKIHGCCLFLNSQFLVKANFLDESVFLYCEEPILSKQVKQNGFNALYIKEITGHHEHYPNLKPGSNSNRMKVFLTSRKYYIEQYSDYSKFGKKVAIMSRTLQSWMWGK